MGTDFDPLDDIFPQPAANNARAGGKFQPKAKPRPRKESSAPLPSKQPAQAVDVGENELTALVGPSLASFETLETEKSLKINEDSISRIHSSDVSALVNPSLEHHVIGEALDHSEGMHSEVVLPNINGDWHSSIGKPTGESADIFFGLESLDFFYSQSTPSTVGAARSPDKVDSGTQLGNEFGTSCHVDNDAGGSIAPSEISTVHVSNASSAKGGHFIPIISPLDDTAVRVSNASSANTCPEVTIPQDPLTCGEAVFSNTGGDYLIENRSLEIEEAEAVPCLETLDSLYDLTTQSGQRSGKFQPKPKFKNDEEKPGTNTCRADGVEPLPNFQDAQSIPSESNYSNEGSIPAFRLNNVLDFPSLGFGDSTCELPVNEEPSNLVETSRSVAFLPGDHPEATPEILENVSQSNRHGISKTQHQHASTSGQENEAGRTMRERGKRANAYVLADEPEDEAHDDRDFTNECPIGSLIDEDGNDEGEFQVANEIRNLRAPRKANKSAPQKEKPVRKRKKVNEAPDESTKKPPKKFSHSTRRKKRQVDKALLETPEDEIDVQKLQIRDLILLAEHRERTSSRGGKTSGAPSINQSAGNYFADYDEDEAFASEQGGGCSNDQENPVDQECPYTNYQTYMNKTPRSRWSKQDTELFYEAVRQFGSDISMIQQLFPDRTRTQVKLKYKKEERQQPLRLHEALTNRSKDHCHFQTVIERLKLLAAQEKQNSYRDDSAGLTGDDQELNPKINEKQNSYRDDSVGLTGNDQELNPKTNEEEVAKPEQAEEEEEAMGPDVREVQSPVKSDDSEDDLYRWSQYKTEL